MKSGVGENQCVEGGLGRQPANQGVVGKGRKGVVSRSSKKCRRSGMLTLGRIKNARAVQKSLTSTNEGRKREEG